MQGVWSFCKTPLGVSSPTELMADSYSLSLDSSSLLFTGFLLVSEFGCYTMVRLNHRCSFLGFRHRSLPCKNDQSTQPHYAGLLGRALPASRDRYILSSAHGHRQYLTMHMQVSSPLRVSALSRSASWTPTVSYYPVRQVYSTLTRALVRRYMQDLALQAQNREAAGESWPARALRPRRPSRPRLRPKLCSSVDGEAADRPSLPSVPSPGSRSVLSC